MDNKLNHIVYDADIHSVTFTRRDTRRHYANLSPFSLHRLVYAVNRHANHPEPVLYTYSMASAKAEANSILEGAR